jgi:hypothetical protein
MKPGAAILGRGWKAGPGLKKMNNIRQKSRLGIKIRQLVGWGKPGGVDKADPETYLPSCTNYLRGKMDIQLGIETGF